jgi:GNAT superfamily N-acetyltransferase
LAAEDIQLERVVPGNFSEFFGLISELADFEKLTPPDAEGMERLRNHAFQNDPFYEAYLVKLEGKYIAYIIYYFTYSSFLAKPTLFLEDIYVKGEHRGKGIGKMLFQFCVEKAEEKRCGRMEWSALNWNKNAIDFYIGMGAVPLSEWTFYRLTEEKIDRLVKRERKDSHSLLYR